MTEPEPIPLIIRTRLAHATLQALADECGADILHIKGAAVDASLRPVREGASDDGSPEERAVTRVSADADVLVRPAHLKRLSASLNGHGWQRRTSLYSGGAVEHSVDWGHGELGALDVHIRFPGMRLAPDRAFAELWRDRIYTRIAHRACPVPAVDTQRLMLLLHAARNGGPASPDIDPCWTNATAAERARVVGLAASFDAEVALAGATGRLDEYADRPEYDLWRLLGLRDADVFELWLAFVKGAPTRADQLRAVVYAVRAKGDRVDLELGHPANATDVMRAQASRLGRGALGIVGLAKRGTRNRQRGASSTPSR